MFLPVGVADRDRLAVLADNATLENRPPPDIPAYVFENSIGVAIRRLDISMPELAAQLVDLVQTLLNAQTRRGNIISSR